MGFFSQVPDRTQLPRAQSHGSDCCNGAVVTAHLTQRARQGTKGTRPCAAGGLMLVTRRRQGSGCWSAEPSSGSRWAASRLSSLTTTGKAAAAWAAASARRLRPGAPGLHRPDQPLAAVHLADGLALLGAHQGMGLQFTAQLTEQAEVSRGVVLAQHAWIPTHPINSRNELPAYGLACAGLVINCCT